MASAIKSLAKHSEEAIELVWKELNREERNAVSSALGKMSTRLGKKKEKPAKKSKVLSDDASFHLYIIPQIQQTLNAFETGELSGEPTLTTALDFKFEWNDLVDEKREHQRIVNVEDNAKTLLLIAQFSRGKFYIHIAKTIKQEGAKNVKQALNDGRLPVSYRTFLRYVAFANDVIRFPRLLVVKLSLSQILLHRKQLLKYFTSVEGLELGAQISKSLTLNVGGKPITIERSDIPSMTPNMRFNTGPDAEYADKHNKAEVCGDGLDAWTEGACAQKDEEMDEEALLEDELKSIHL